MTADSAAGTPARVVLVGVRGFGEVHAANIARLADLDLVDLVSAVDPAVAAEADAAYGVPLFADLAVALATTGPVDVVVIAAPIGAHFQLAETALAFGADVLLEKPPVASLADFTALLDIEQASGRVVQVGFQSLGSAAIELLQADAFDIGEVTRVSAVGAWSRTVGYWTRSAWAGRRSVHGRPVIDGVVTNALAHAVVTSLAVVGCRAANDVATVETDLYRANAIDSDDTSVVRIRTVDGRQVTCALTLCAPEQRDPVVILNGTRGRATFAYKEDTVEIENSHGVSSRATGRTDLLENLVAHRRSATPLLVPLVSTGAFMRVLDAVARADEPIRIDAGAISWVGEGPERRAVVADVERWVERAAASGHTFAELGADWAHRRRDQILVRARVGETEVAEYRDGRGTIPDSSPRPYLHPVRTQAGVVVSAQHPADHDWHLGVGMAIPSVNGTSFWGGGTYLHGQGYVRLDDHGTIVGDLPEPDDEAFTQKLRWLGRDGTLVLRENRSVGWTAIDQRSWRLDFATTLRAEVDVVCESPGSKGRVGGGYGGFFWRFPACSGVKVFTADANGEDDVHGRVAPWLAWTADFQAGPGLSGPATIVLASAGAADASEPWFVRAASYPGVGSALAWDRPLRLFSGAVWSRHFTAAVVDGQLDLETVSTMATGLLAPTTEPGRGTLQTG